MECFLGCPDYTQQSVSQGQGRQVHMICGLPPEKITRNPTTRATTILTGLGICAMRSQRIANWWSQTANQEHEFVPGFS